MSIDTAQHVADRLARIDGVIAVVLGGSRAQGIARPNSDIDLGIYYDPDHRPSLDALRALAKQLDDRHADNLVTAYGEWGTWINGGGWLDIGGQRVDWLYRNLAQVEHEIAECEAGRPRIYYQPGHPHGFYNHIYMGEVFYCQPLYQRDDRLSRLKARTIPYPPLLKQAMIQSLWEAQFSLDNAHKPATRADTAQVVGYLYRATAIMTQALFALNERYCINEKGAVAQVEGMSIHPIAFQRRIVYLLGAAGGTPDTLGESIAAMQRLLTEVQSLCSHS